MIIKTIITTLDNLPLLKEQINLLKDDKLIGEIIVVNNGSIDGTKEWLDTQTGITIIHRENNGAGPGRNAGLNKAGYFDYVLMLDGGIRPLIGGTELMLDYLESNKEVDVISPEVATCFTTDYDLAHRRMFKRLTKDDSFLQSSLSSTAYALCNWKSWNNIRFSEEGPYAEPGWGVDDNDMAYRWNSLGITHHDFVGVLCYRRASGSFARLYKETGIWPNQYGSVYEKRNVLCWQQWPNYHRGLYGWPGEIEKSFVIDNIEYPDLAKRVKQIHNDNRKTGYEIIVNDSNLTQSTIDWLDIVCLRWHWGDTVIDKQGNIIKKNPNNEMFWTGDIIRNKSPRGKVIKVV